MSFAENRSSNQEPLRKELGPHIFDFIKGKRQFTSDLVLE